jgi:hypothetical protein
LKEGRKKMNYQDVYTNARNMNAVRLYDQSTSVIGGRATGIASLFEETSDEGLRGQLRRRHEEYHQLMNPLTVAADLLRMEESEHYTVMDHMLVDPEMCRFALEAIARSVKDFRVPEELIFRRPSEN